MRIHARVRTSIILLTFGRVGANDVYRETRNVHNASDGIMVLMARINPCVLTDNNSPLTAADFYFGNGVYNIRELHVDGVKGLG